MMRMSIRFLLLCALVNIVTIGVYGQEKFDEQLAAVSQMTAYKAIYQLEQYQAKYPDFAATYYHLGRMSEEVLPSLHPILNYDYLKRILYNIRVYYGNCIHYANNSSFKNEHYIGIPIRGKNVEYADIARFSREKLAKVKNWQCKLDSLYNNYFQVVERYGHCRRMFSDFSELYPGEKQAHLRLQPQDVELLNRIATQYDSLLLDIEAYQESLRQYPIEQVSPTFVYTDIRLYRLDGLTHTSFMDSTINLWNYGGFAKDFLREQYSTYAKYYQTISDEYLQISDAISKLSKGEKLEVKSNKILINYINKMDYKSFMVPLTSIQQMCADMLHCHAIGVFVDNDSILEQDYIEYVLRDLYMKYLTMDSCSSLVDVMRSRLSDDEIVKYKQVLGADTTIRAIGYLAYNRLQVADSIYTEISKQVHNILSSQIVPFEYYKDELSDMVIYASQIPFGSAEIVTILPLVENYLIVYQDGLFVEINAQLEHTRSFVNKQHTPIVAAYKIGGSMIAIVTPERVFYVKG